MKINAFVKVGATMLLASTLAVTMQSAEAKGKTSDPYSKRDSEIILGSFLAGAIALGGALAMEKRRDKKFKSSQNIQAIREKSLNQSAENNNDSKFDFFK
jgi:hypothetical protein